MKLNGRAAAIVLAMVAIIIIGMDFRVEASQYLGQVTWTWHKTTDEHGATDKTETIVANLFLLGNSCYELVGSSTDTEIGGTAFGGGTAVLVGTNLIMTLSYSKIRSDGRQETGIFQGQVNKTSFNGSGWGIKKRFDPASIGASPVFIDKYMAGTLTVVGNPPPLGPTPIAPMQLLLLDDK
ncbi:MAG: hypothetical protein KKD99_08650 [Proteobacteria bacterium]|nr:hypothetical protein [Pseudomonadota bacterium]MBU4356996.1 hypothetical protein [Pseudomonadota bacterium]MBU4448642.1 hypothetical protein [Pseudomonadota bacterium]MCG2773917.1 hypothetical protein [Desulfobacterales bacterium]